MVTQGRECLFGHEVEGAIRLNAYGVIVETTWQWLADQYPYLTLDEWVVMPNHLHGVLVIHDAEEDCRRGGSRTALTRTAPTDPVKRKPLGRLLGAFKTVSSKQINKVRNTSGAMVWQRNYYEHIIRNDDDHKRIDFYIASNIDNWANDDENPNRLK